MTAGYVLLGALLAVYLLVFAPPAMRRIEFESSVYVRCTPMQVFALVSNPNSWPRYVPQLQLRSAVATPVKIGDLIYDRVAAEGLTHDGVERVIASDPGVSFGTQMVTGGHGTTGVYELFAADGGTDVVYRCRATLTLFEAWAGNGFRRGYLTAKLKAARDPIMQQIKVLLEAGLLPSSV